MIRKLSAQYPVREICEALSISRSGYYAAALRQSRSSDRQRRAAELYEHIEQVFYQNRRCYGSPRVTRQLRTQGQCCSENRVARLMRANGLKARQKRSFRPRTTIRAKEPLIAPNHLAELPIEKIEDLNQVWVSDITYIPTASGWLYLAVLIPTELWKSSDEGWHHAYCKRPTRLGNFLAILASWREDRLSGGRESRRGAESAKRG